MAVAISSQAASLKFFFLYLGLALSKTSGYYCINSRRRHFHEKSSSSSSPPSSSSSPRPSGIGISSTGLIPASPSSEEDSTALFCCSSASLSSLLLNWPWTGTTGGGVGVQVDLDFFASAFNFLGKLPLLEILAGADVIFGASIKSLFLDLFPRPLPDMITSFFW